MIFFFNVIIKSNTGKLMKVDLIDIKYRYLDEHKQILESIKRLLKKGNLVLTEEVKSFEEKISSYTKMKYCLGLNSGTDALMMSLWSMGIKKGDEVITTPISFIASAGAIAHLGAKPVFVDVGKDFNIDPKKIEGAITKKTKAIMPVHWGGRICDMDAIINISKKYNIPIVEDAAQGMGAYYKKKHSGSFGLISAFSGHPLKNLGAIGDSGFVVTNNRKLYNKIKLYRSHGLVSRDKTSFYGVNSRIDAVNAEVLSFRLKKLRSVVSKRNRNVRLYRKYLKNNVLIPKNNSYETNSYVMFLVLCDKRDKLQDYLKKYNIQSLVYYGTPLHLHGASKYLGYKRGDFPIAENICKKVLALPHHQYLEEKQIKYVCDKVNKFYGVE